MQKHFSQAMERVEGLINLWSASSSMNGGVSLLAVSGGVDSMCMADLFLKSYGPDRIALAHCNFHLRGEESDGDEALVRSWADENGVRCHVTSFQTEKYAREQGVSIEMAARDLRYGWFAQLCKEYGYAAVAVAHNANDNAETLLLNLLRGTGLRGLGGMSPVSDMSCVAHPRQKLIRPLLECTRKMIEGYAFAHKVPYREDSTNASSDYKRNRIRNEVFPLFEKINPSFIRTLNREMGYFAEASDIVDDYCAANTASVTVGVSPSVPREVAPSVIARSDATRQSPHMTIPKTILTQPHWRYLLYYILEPYGFNHSVLASLEDMLVSDRTVSGKRFESDTHILLTERDALVVLSKDAAPKPTRPECQSPLSHGKDFMAVPGPGTYHVAGRVFHIEQLPWTSDMPLKLPHGVLLFDAARLQFPFSLRRWRQGDWLVPFGMKGKKKVSDMFTDLKYDSFAKSSAVMLSDSRDSLASEGHIAALLGVRIDERYRVTDATTDIIRVTELPG